MNRVATTISKKKRGPIGFIFKLQMPIKNKRYQYLYNYNNIAKVKSNYN